jgi:ech hydrogenase subunit A
MGVIAFLIAFPFLAAFILAFMQKHRVFRSVFVFFCCAVLIAAVLYYSVTGLILNQTLSFLPETHNLDLAMLVAEAGLMILIVGFAVKFRKYYVAVLSVVQTGLVIWLDLSGKNEVASAPHIFSDKLTIMMCLIIGIIGTLICVYAVGYMKEYHEHHKEYKDRSAFFFAMLFVFLGAMFGLVFSNNLIWMYFFWEITSLCSFLLIGYTKTGEAMNNAFRALWMNLLGGLGFAIAIVFAALQYGVGDLQGFVALGSGTQAILIPLALLAFAGLTKSAQLPFSSWLLGAMVAPTPTSALLHSATMVKAGVFLLIRLSPMFHGNLVGTMVTTIGGFTFLMTSMLAISQSDGKKVLAYSTISNLGLITACAGVGLHEAVWAGILLMLFHAVSKSLMFLSVGAVENSIGSRNIEDMHGLIVKLPGLAFIMITGIAGMFLAPFGMLISKWAALKAFVDSNSMLLVIFLVFGSATTLFYWTKWLGKLVAVLHNSARLHSKVGTSQWISLVSQATIMIGLCVLFPLISTNLVEPFLAEMFHSTLPAIISDGNMKIMLMMLFAIVILPIAVRFLTFAKKQKVVMSYMGGANSGDDRNFTDSFGENKEMYLANWYMEDYFGEKKLLLPSIILAAAIIAVLLGIVIGGAL